MVDEPAKVRTPSAKWETWVRAVRRAMAASYPHLADAAAKQAFTGLQQTAHPCVTLLHLAGSV